MRANETTPILKPGGIVKPSGWVEATDGKFYPRCAVCGKLLGLREKRGTSTWRCPQHAEPRSR